MGRNDNKGIDESDKFDKYAIWTLKYSIFTFILLFIILLVMENDFGLRTKFREYRYRKEDRRMIEDFINYRCTTFVDSTKAANDMKLIEEQELFQRVKDSLYIDLKKIMERRHGKYGSTNGYSRNTGWYYDDDDEEDEHHPGTKPDDGLFGFDPWDDEDDAYNMERNQIDPWPDMYPYEPMKYDW